MLAAYVASVWFLVLRALVRPQRVGARLVATVVVGEVVLVLAYLLGVAPRLTDHGNLLADVALIGLPEELLKALPVVAVALVLRRRGVGVAPRDLLFLAATSGLVLGAVEAVDYGVLLNPYAGVGMALVLRFATDPIQHALWAGVAGYFLGLATHHRAVGPGLVLAGIGLGVPVVLHGLDDWTPVTATVAWVGVQTVSALLFLGLRPDRGRRAGARAGGVGPTGGEHDPVAPHPRSPGGRPRAGDAPAGARARRTPARPRVTAARPASCDDSEVPTTARERACARTGSRRPVDRIRRRSWTSRPPSPGRASCSSRSTRRG